MNTKVKNYTDTQKEAYPKQVGKVIREYMTTKHPSDKEPVIDDIHIEIYQALLDSEDVDIEFKIMDREKSCVDLLKLLTNPEVSKLMGDSKREEAVEMLSSCLDFFKFLKDTNSLTLLHLTFVEQFGYTDLETVEWFEEEYAQRLELAKFENKYKLKVS